MNYDDFFGLVFGKNSGNDFKPFTAYQKRIAIEGRHAFPSAEQQARQVEAIPRHVANSMAFEGDPLPLEWLQAQRWIFYAKAAKARRNAVALANCDCSISGTVNRDQGSET